MSPAAPENEAKSSEVESSGQIADDSALNLAALLTQRRRELKLSLAQAERATKIRRHYLELIEKGDYSGLKNDVYSKGYVASYADYLGFDTAPILTLYKKERSAHQQNLRLRDEPAKLKIGLKPIYSPKWIITPKTFLVLWAISLFILVAGYLVWQFAAVSAAPKLTLDGALTQTVTSDFAYVSGKVQGGADVFIDDSPILTAADGTFREKVALVAGVNQVKVSAKNKLGKTTVINRTFIDALTNKTAVSTTPIPEKFDGVEVRVKVAKQASWLIVVADDKEIFRGTMLDGTEQIFRAASKLRLTLGNAGSVDLTLTNLQVLRKNLGVVGKEGEVKRDLEFTKDTVAL